MRRWLELWHLRRRRDQLQDRVDWIREHVYSGQIALEAAEHKLHEVQAELWAIEPIEFLLQPSRTDSGVTLRG